MLETTKLKASPAWPRPALENTKSQPGLNQNIFPKKRRIFLPRGDDEVTTHFVLAPWTYPTNIISTSHQKPDAALETPECETVLCCGQSGTVWPGRNNCTRRIKENQRGTQCNPEFKFLSLFCLCKQLLGQVSALQILLLSLLCEKPASCTAFLYLGSWKWRLAFQISTFKMLDLRSLFLVSLTLALHLCKTQTPFLLRMNWSYSVN